MPSVDPPRHVTTTSSATVREASRLNAPTVAQVARESWHGAYDEIVGVETVDDVVDEWYDVDSLENSIEDAADREDATFLVAEDADEYELELVGFAHAGPNPEDADTAELARIYVHPEAWGDGTGRALLKQVERDLGERYDRLRLSVLAENEIGVAFYESTGFDRVESRSSDLGEDLEEYVYEKSLA